MKGAGTVVPHRSVLRFGVGGSWYGAGVESGVVGNGVAAAFGTTMAVTTAQAHAGTKSFLVSSAVGVKGFVPFAPGTPNTLSAWV
jgi:hypothetical protein